MPKPAQVPDAFTTALSSGRENQFFYLDTTESPDSFRPACVIYMDLLGASYAYATSLETPLNSLLRTNIAVDLTVRAFPEIETYQFADSHYFTLPSVKNSLAFVNSLYHNILLANGSMRGWCFGHFILPRITIATGPIYEGRRLPAEKRASIAANILLGPGVLAAYRLEKQCPPLGAVFSTSDEAVLDELRNLRFDTSTKSGRLLHRYCCDAEFRAGFQRSSTTTVFPWFLFSVQQLGEGAQQHLQPARTAELISKFDLMHLILHRFWHEYRMQAHRMSAEVVTQLPKSKRKKGSSRFDIDDGVCRNMGMYERMLLDYFSLIGGHPITMSSFERISFLRNHLVPGNIQTRFP